MNADGTVDAVEPLHDSAMDQAAGVVGDVGLGRPCAGFLNGGLSQHPLFDARLHPLFFPLIEWKADFRPNFARIGSPF